MAKKSPLQQVLNEIQSDVTNRIELLQKEISRSKALVAERVEELKILQKKSKLFIKECGRGIEEEKKRIVVAIASAKIIEPLTKLKTSNQVAKFLKELKIKGYKGLTDACPIAEYLNKNAPKDAEGLVDNYSMSLDGVEISHTKATKAFIEKFDEGSYPDLDECPDDTDAYVSWED